MYMLKKKFDWKELGIDLLVLQQNLPKRRR